VGLPHAGIEPYVIPPPVPRVRPVVKGIVDDVAIVIDWDFHKTVLHVVRI
jgi:hypothetical protein